MEQGLVIIKPHVLLRPDATVVVGDIIQRFGKAGLDLIQIKMMRLSEDQASHFYRVHKERPFYRDLVENASSGPCLVMVIGGIGSKSDVIMKLRDLAGAPNPRHAEPGSIRADYAVSIADNAVYVSLDSAERDILFFFPEMDLLD
jgi:nucleoside-diphosphate kinase